MHILRVSSSFQQLRGVYNLPRRLFLSILSICLEKQPQGISFSV